MELAAWLETDLRLKSLRYVTENMGDAPSIMKMFYCTLEYGK